LFLPYGNADNAEPDRGLRIFCFRYRVQKRSCIAAAPSDRDSFFASVSVETQTRCERVQWLDVVRYTTEMDTPIVPIFIIIISRQHLLSAQYRESREKTARNAFRA